MGLRRILAGPWGGPLYVGTAICAALVTGTIVRQHAYDPERWPRSLTVIERQVPPGEQAEFLERLCSEGKDRGFRCAVGREGANFQPVGYVELWEDEVHVTALAFAPVPLVRIQLFADRGDSVAVEEGWLREM